MATKPGSGNDKGNNRTPTRDSGIGQDRRPANMPGRGPGQVNHRDTTVSRVQPRRDGGNGGSGGDSKG